MLCYLKIAEVVLEAKGLTCAWDGDWVQACESFDAAFMEDLKNCGLLFGGVSF